MSGAGAMVLAAPPCSSWTRVSRGTTMRTRLNPMGLCYNFISAGNLTIARLLGIYIYIVCHADPINTVDGKNPAPVRKMVYPVKKISILQDFFHPQFR